MPRQGVVRGALGVDVGGFTLVETGVVLAIIGLMAAMSGLAIASLRPNSRDDALRELARARAAAIRTGNRVVVTHDAQRTARIVFLPDGRALGPGLDPLTGTVRDSLR